MQAEVSYLNGVCGLSLSPEEICDLLGRMGHSAKPSNSSPTALLDVSVPINRADILHQCDLMEDVGIAYGFNKLPRVFPNTGAGVSAPLLLNKLADIVRFESAMAGWSEVMPLTLCSHDENFALLNRKDDGNTCVTLQNPKSAEYQIVRTSLLPGLLKTLRENKAHSIPMKIFEVGDVVFKDLSSERKTRNVRHFGAAWYGKASGFEVIHGLLDRVMLMLKVQFSPDQEGMAKDDLTTYWIEEDDSPTYLVGHAASIHVKFEGKDKVIGEFGILHPSVLKAFELP
jgi:phenylalanyl-tRNA synthetase beta chain